MISVLLCMLCFAVWWFDTFCANSVDIVCSWFMYRCFDFGVLLFELVMRPVCLVILCYIVVSWWLGLFLGLFDLVVVGVGLRGFVVG